MAFVASCGGGNPDAGTEGSFVLIEFLESGQNNIPRNRPLTLKFSATVMPGQDFFERLKIENVQTGASSNFSRAIGVYVVTGAEVVFLPRLPQKVDRSDAGFRPNGDYTVFLKAGPDALISTSGDRIGTQQEFVFETNEFFEDPLPNDAPRALGLVARNPVSGDTTELGRLDPNATTLAAQDNATLIGAGRVIEPGVGAGYAVPWQFDLLLSEPLDPSTITTRNIEMFEIFSDATTSGPLADPAVAAGVFGTPVLFKVPISVAALYVQSPDGTTSLRARVTPLGTLVDNTRYRLRFSGDLLGLDYRKAFIGENGLTGDGLTVAEPGGLGYTTEFIVRDVPASFSSRSLTYDPFEDGILPENGQTELDEERYNSALYNPATFPGEAVGFLSAFGSGVDGPLAVGNGTTVLDTGDTRNPDLGNPFTVTDLDPTNQYLTDSRPGQPITYDSPEPFELEIESLTIGTTATLRINGVNPIFIRVAGIVQINGTLDISGGDGQAGGGGIANPGIAGAGAYAGGATKRGSNACTYCSSCLAFQNYLNGCAAASSGFPHTNHGNGPGRGYAGGEIYVYDYQDDFNAQGGTGGGGASHATLGGRGEDRLNAGGAPGTDGPSCGLSCPTKVAGIIGIRGEPGALYGDREIVTNLVGGSGGGGGGSVSVWGGPKAQAGGAGGGGGGSMSVIASGAILITGTVDASGGDGGMGGVAIQSQPNNWRSTSGGGGGGSGGSVALISGANLNVATAVLTAAGGAGGPRSANCNACNAGGAGGKGFLFLMDADGIVDGLFPGTPGEYDSFAGGVLTISSFDTGRFSSIAAITELFNVLSANPTYTMQSPDDVVGTVDEGQRVRIFVSAAQQDPLESAKPDLTSETAQFEVALLSFVNSTITSTITGDMGDLNADPTKRFPYVRVDARFEYDNGVDAALGPFAAISLFIINFSFNG